MILPLNQWATNGLLNSPINTVASTVLNGTLGMIVDTRSNNITTGSPEIYKTAQCIISLLAIVFILIRFPMSLPYISIVVVGLGLFSLTQIVNNLFIRNRQIEIFRKLDELSEILEVKREHTVSDLTSYPNPLLAYQSRVSESSACILSLTEKGLPVFYIPLSIWLDNESGGASLSSKSNQKTAVTIQQESSGSGEWNITFNDDAESSIQVEKYVKEFWCLKQSGRIDYNLLVKKLEALKSGKMQFKVRVG